MTIKRPFHPLTLQTARMISYSQLYQDERPSIESFVMNIPTADAVEWCSYIIFRKNSLQINGSDIHILAPLLFCFENELQKKIHDYLNGYYNRKDSLIDRYSFLRLISYLITHSNSNHHELTKDEKTRLFKAYLLLCDEYLERISCVKPIPHQYTSEDILKSYLPVQLLTNDIAHFSDPTLELVKGKWFFVDFAKTDKIFSKYVDDFVKAHQYNSPTEYLGLIFNIVANTITHTPPTSIIQFNEDSDKWINFMNSMSSEHDDFVDDDNLNALRSKPVFRTDKNRYTILFSKFFVDKMFNGMLFDLAATLTGNGTFNENVTAYLSIKQQVGERFSEQFLLYRTLEHSLSKRIPVKYTGADLHKVLKKGEPDYYARRNNRIFVFEFKDVRLDAQTKTSCDYERISRKLFNCFVENEVGKPKGVRQLSAVIEKTIPEIISKIDISAPLGAVKIYPILVYTDCSFDIEGVNYYLNNEFKKSLNQIDDRYEVKDMVMMNLDLLMMLENWFVNGKIELDKVLNEYLAFKESKEQLKTVPFNKYLFQYALKKGFDQTFTETIKNTFDELLRIEKETIVCTQS